MVDLYRPISEGLLTEEPTRFSDMYGTGATGLLFAPGAGVTDLMGYAPDPMQPGEYLPSFGENIREGNYLDAALQTLGGAGDVMMAGGAFLPPLVGVGAAMKAPRAARVAARSEDVFSEVADFPSLSKSEEQLVAASSAPPEEVAGLGRVITEPIDPENMAASRARFNELQEMTSGYEQERAKARIVKLDDGTDAIQYMEPPATVQAVSIGDLKATQPGLLTGGDAALTEGPPLVVKKGGELFVRDGHHRLARMIEAGADTADVRVVDLDAGGLLGVGAAMKAPRAIRAYHGSPYDFDRFDLNKIGSGEGAQAFGHGLYFTDSEDIAEGYRKNTRGLRDLRSGIDVSYKGNRSEGLGDSLEDEAAKAVIYHMTKPGRSRYPDQAKEKAIQFAQKNIEDFSAPEMAEVLGAEDQALYVERLKRELKAVSEINPDEFDISQGKTYEVEISAAPEGLLDYDARLKDQNPEIKKRVRDMVENEMTEMDAVNLGYDLGEEVDLKGAKDFMLSDDTTVDQFLGNWQALRGSTDAGEFLLNKYGIPGLKYKAGGSRAPDMDEADTDRNYVIFDENIINILRKYGLLAPLVGGGTAAAVMGADEPQPAGGIL